MFYDHDEDQLGSFFFFFVIVGGSSRIFHLDWIILLMEEEITNVEILKVLEAIGMGSENLNMKFLVFVIDDS